MAIRLDKSKLVKNLATNYKLVPHLDKVIGEGDFKWSYEYKPKQGDDAWHPSGHCTPSPFELYHIAQGGGEEPISPGLWKTFQVGHFWHQYLQWFIEKRLEFCGTDAIERRGMTAWKRDGRIFQSQWPAQGETTVFRPETEPFHWATGSADIAPCEIPGHGPYLVDFKTMGSHDFKRNDAPAWAVDKWECQVNIYMDWFDLDKTLILGILKDSPHDFKEFTFHRNEPLVEAIYKKWKLVSACLDEGVVPPENEHIELPLKGPVTS